MSFRDDTLDPANQTPGPREATLGAFYDLEKRTIRSITKRHHEFTGRQGWHESTTLMEKCALIASEVGEAINELRNNKPTPDFALELADIVLRTCDTAACAGIDLTGAILDKMDINDKREANGDFKHKIK